MRLLREVDDLVISSYNLAVLIPDAICLILFCLIAQSFAKIYFKLRTRSLLHLSLSFGLLALSQASSILSILVESGRLSLTFYTLTSSLAAIGFLLIVASVSSRDFELFATTSPILISMPDLLACSLAATASIMCQGKQLRAYLLSLSLVHAIRGFSIFVAPLDSGALLLISAEVARAVATLLFAIFHLSRVVGRG